MKATIEIPDELYRRVKAKSALEGRAIRQVTEELYRSYVEGDPSGAVEAKGGAAPEVESEEGPPPPPWFAMLRDRVQPARRHDLESIRESIGRGLGRDLEL